MAVWSVRDYHVSLFKPYILPHTNGAIALFSLYLTPKAIGNAEMTIGGIDTTKFTGVLVSP